MDLHQKEVQGFFDIPVDNLRASPFLIQYIKESVSCSLYQTLGELSVQLETFDKKFTLYYRTSYQSMNELFKRTGENGGQVSE